MESKTKHLKFFGIGKILPFLTNIRGQIFIMVSLALVSSLVDILIPQFQRYALDQYIGTGVMDTIIPFVIAYIAVILTAAVVNYISCALATIVEMKVNRELRQTGFRHLQTLSFSYFNQNSVGYIHARLMSDTGRIGGLVSWTLIDCTWRVSYLVGVVFMHERQTCHDDPVNGPHTGCPVFYFSKEADPGKPGGPRGQFPDYQQFQRRYHGRKDHQIPGNRGQDGTSLYRRNCNHAQ